MSQKMHSNPQHPSQPTLERSPEKQSADSTLAITPAPPSPKPAAKPAAKPASKSTSPHQPDSHQDWNHNDIDPQTIPNLSSKELVKLASTSADELMDTVFEDVDYMLDKGVSIVPQSSPQQATQDVTTAQGYQAATMVPPHAEGNSAPELLPQSAHRSPAVLPEATAESPQGSDPTAPTNPYQWGKAVGFALPILGACATLGVALAAGFLLYGPGNILRPEVATTDAEPVGNNADRVFAEYMERALESIVTTDDATANAGSTSDGDGDSNLTDESETDRRFADVPERVYIPVYQPSQPPLSTLPTVPVNGNLASSPPLVSATPGGTSPDGNPLAIAPVPFASAPPVPLTVPNSSAVSPSDSTAPNSTIPQSPTSNSTASDLSYDHVLVGLLQLGDRSVAMFDYAEGTHRVQVGEPIGSSGWSLVSVSESEAIIRRNGDVRSIYIGQSF